MEAAKRGGVFRTRKTKEFFGCYLVTSRAFATICCRSVENYALTSQEFVKVLSRLNAGSDCLEVFGLTYAMAVWTLFQWKKCKIIGFSEQVSKADPLNIEDGFMGRVQK